MTLFFIVCCLPQHKQSYVINGYLKLQPLRKPVHWSGVQQKQNWLVETQPLKESLKKLNIYNTQKITSLLYL